MVKNKRTSRISTKLQRRYKINYTCYNYKTGFYKNTIGFSFLESREMILFVSALDAAQEMVSILPGIGIDDVIRKPVDSEQFLSKVKMTFAASYNSVAFFIHIMYIISSSNSIVLI
ncbi:MAG: hypothetical protein ACJ71G_07115 [Nitrososphaeraceae archaeon]